jgi:hypothetical protein
MFAKLRAGLLALPALALGACDSADRLTEPADDVVDVVSTTGISPDQYTQNLTFPGGIPIGHFAQPTAAFGPQYTGGLRIINAPYLLEELATIKARGAKVVLNLAGGQVRYTDRNGHFSMSMWKASVDRYKNVNFSSYINDGTVVSHYLVDEPQDEANWNGTVITPVMLEEMARYSKQLWPNLPTVVRAFPDYLAGLTGKYRYLDAAWAQFVYRFGDADEFTRENVALAQAKGLSLIAGLNVTKGGLDQRPLTASQLRSWGSSLLSSTYICALINWEYDAQYLEQADIKTVMAELGAKARNHATRSCRGINNQTSGSVTDPAVDPAPLPTAPAPTSPTTAAIQISLRGVTQIDSQYYMLITWSGAIGAQVDLYRNGQLRKRKPANTGRTYVIVDPRSQTPYTFKICDVGTSRCSITASVTLN